MISALDKISLILPRKEKLKVLKLLQSFGQSEIVEIKNKKRAQKDTEQLNKKIEALNLKLNEIDFCLALLQEYKKEEVKSLWEKLTATKPSLTIEEMAKKYKEIDLDKIIAQCKRGEARINKIQNELSILKEKQTELEGWKKLTSLPQETKFTLTITGKALLNNYLALSHTLEKEIKEIALERVYQDLKYVYLSLTFNKAYEERVRSILNNYKFETKEWEQGIKNPARTLRNLKKEIKKLKVNLKREINLLTRLAQKIDSLQLAYDWLFFKKERLQAQKNCYTTRYFTIITLWIERNKLKILRKKIKKLNPQIVIEKECITKKDKPPVIIHNKSLVTPFEAVTGIYGLPKFRELDPTPFLAPFFILFFALCLTDAGYGLVMALLSLLAIKIMKIPRPNQKLFRLLIYGGIITFFVGTLFGGWFGIDLTNLPDTPLKALLLKLRLINPMTDTLLFMGLTFVLGFVQIWFSQVVKLYHSIKIKTGEEILQAILWIAFLSSLLFLGIAKYFSPLLVPLALYLFLACLICLIMLTNKKINIFVRPFIGLITVLQTLIGFMSDILSYSRLMALGLATGIIGFIINIIAGIFRDMIPYLGWLVWILILIGGHLFNIGINALGGFIHSARLQFVEFFPKFLEGGGRKFQPLSFNSRFVEIKK